ncbi:MAG TPA: hypothetical protein V6D08_13440 [Candidatus Obscuribacterales bacterium]
MPPDAFSPTIFVALIILCVSLVAFRTVCLNRGAPGVLGQRTAGKGDIGAVVEHHPLLGEHLDSVPLRPVELAYIVRDGDMPHATVVLVFDLLHRAVKSLQGESQAVALAPYERRLWDKVKAHATRWIEERASQVIPDPRSGDIRLLVRQISGLYWLIVRSIKPFVSEVLEDPRRIRRYFSVGGLLRLLADVGSAGYREALESELVADMMARGLLITSEARKQTVTYLLIGLVSGIIISLLLPIVLLHNAGLAVSAWVLSALTAVLLRLVFSLREFVPLYTELSDVVNHVQRGGWRIAVLRTLLRVFAVFATLLLVVLASALVSVQVLFLKLVFACPLTFALALSVVLILCWLALVTLALDAYRMKIHYQPSPLARELVRSTRGNLAGVSPLESFKGLLKNPRYDPEFSRLLAIYGIETLVILV